MSGRPKLTPEQRAEVVELRRRRVAYRQLAKQFGVSVDTITRVLRNANVQARVRHLECAPDCSRPPPPPPGFDERDLRRGKPAD